MVAAKTYHRCSFKQESLSFCKRIGITRLIARYLKSCFCPFLSVSMTCSCHCACVCSSSSWAATRPLTHHWASEASTAAHSQDGSCTGTVTTRPSRTFSPSTSTPVRCKVWRIGFGIIFSRPPKLHSKTWEMKEQHTEARSRIIHIRGFPGPPWSPSVYVWGKWSPWPRTQWLKIAIRVQSSIGCDLQSVQASNNQPSNQVAAF